MSASNGGIGAGASSVDEFLQKHNLPPEARDDLQQIVQQITRQQSIKVRVPATTANMGPGFDATGMALDIWNDLTVERAPKFEMNIVGEGADQIPKDETNFVCQGVEAAYEYMGKPVPSLKYSCVNRVPFCRGLGSSSAAVVSGIIAGLALEDHQLTTDTKEELLQIACKIEVGEWSGSLCGGCVGRGRFFCCTWSGALGRGRTRSVVPHIIDSDDEVVLLELLVCCWRARTCDECDIHMVVLHIHMIVVAWGGSS